LSPEEEAPLPKEIQSEAGPGYRSIQGFGPARFGLVLAWLAVIAAATHWPADTSLMRALPDIPYGDKPVHVSLYFVLGVLLWYRRQASYAELAGVLLLAALDELTQPWVGRTADFTDWCADAIGATVALGIASLWPPGRRITPTHPEQNGAF